MKTRIILCIFILFSCGKQKDPTKSMFQIYIQATGDVPEGASGSFDPYSETFSLLSITRTADDGVPESLFADSAKEVRVNHKPQLIYEAEIPKTDYLKSFQSLDVVFDPSVKAVSLHQTTGQTLTLSSGALTYGSFTIAKAETLAFTVEIHWKNTVTRDLDAKTDDISLPKLVIVTAQ